jgi:hypothetical protein
MWMKADYTQLAIKFSRPTETVMCIYGPPFSFLLLLANTFGDVELGFADMLWEDVLSWT